MLTDRGLISQRPNDIGGVQRLYDLGNGYSLSLINAPMAHSYPFAWEAAIIGPDDGLAYSTPLTHDVEVFLTDDETNAFIEKAFQWAQENPHA